MTVGGLLAFLIANGPSFLSAGVTISSIVTQFFADFTGRKKDDEVTPEEFNNFIDKCIGTREALLALVTRAQKDLAG